MKALRYFKKGEWALWIGSVSLVLVSFLLFDRGNFLTVTASLIGVTSLIFNAKGHPAGQLLMVIFSVLYGVISYTFAYYGEMITYLGMTAPMAIAALVSWLKHPFKGARSQVEVGTLTRKNAMWMAVLTVVVTVAFYYVLRYFHTANLFFSTLSVATSFVAAYLTFRRSPFFALAYAANDVVLIVLWVLASLVDRAYFSVTVCFVVFLANDLYGFFNWCKMQKKQAKAVEK